MPCPMTPAPTTTTSRTTFAPPAIGAQPARSVRRGAFLAQQVHEGVEGHGLEVLAAAPARRDTPRLDLLLAHHHGEGDLLELGLADLGAELLARPVELDPEA